MDRYIEAKLTGEKLTHLTHTEDLFLFGNEAGGFAIQALKEVFNALRGDKTNYKITTKVDGSPSYTAASNFNGESFVSTKGFFAKDRKIAYTPEDVDNYFGHAPDLARKLKKLLSYVSALGIPDNEIWQGDFLFDDESLRQETIDGEKVVMFHPNTIIYAVPVTDPLARKIMRAEVGIAWHTVYRGDTYDTLKIAFDADVDKLHNLPSVFQIDSRIPGLGTIGLSKEEELEIRILIENVVNLYNENKQSGILETIAGDKALQKYLLTYQNLLIKTKNTEKEDLQIDGMKGWVALTFDKEIEKKKQPQTQERYRAKKEEELQKIENLREDLERVLLLQDKARQVKELLIKKLNGLGSFRKLVKHIDQGYLPTGEEGFAISDVDGNIQKFVSRLEFSKNNFSQEIVKGWMSDQRIQEKMVKIPDDVDPEISDALSQIVARAKEFTPEEISKLKQLLNASDTRRKWLLDEFINSFPTKFIKEIGWAVPGILEGMDTEILESLITKEPVLLPAHFNEATTGDFIDWVTITEKALLQRGIKASKIPPAIEALKELIEVAPGDNAGMGPGEVMISLLSSGEKGSVGDIFLPGVGEIEIKANGGLLKSMRSSIGSNSLAETKAIAVIREYPELVEVIPPSILEGPAGRKTKVGPLTFSAKYFNLYRIITDTLQDKASQFYTQYLSAIFEDALFTSVSNRYLRGAVNGLIQKDQIEVMANMTAIFFEKYQESDNFDLFVLLQKKKDGSKMTAVKDAEELYKKIKKGVIKVVPFTLGTHENSKAPGLILR